MAAPMAASTSNQVIELAPMQQLAEAVDKEDDWTGLTDAVARRRRQNRLNQRAYRRRKALEPQSAQHSQHDTIPASLELPQRPTEVMQLSPQGQYVLEVLLRTLNNRQPGAPSSLNENPAYTTPFPLSTDHLIPLIQLNVLRATLTNMSILSILHQVPLECGTPLLPLLPRPSSMPACLEPTPLQKRTPHAHWIDVIPSPTMRDNCIRWAGTIDEDDLCSDFIGGLWEGHADCDTKGWVVWTDPWDIGGWEATEGFVRKWGYLLRGCADVLDATNRWRAVRGEDALVLDL